MYVGDPLSNQEIDSRKGGTPNREGETGIAVGKVGLDGLDEWEVGSRVASYPGYDASRGVLAYR